MSEPCACYCHQNSGASCNVDAGYGVGCGPHVASEGEGSYCDRCGSTAQPGHQIQHVWVEGDCALPHRRHAPAKVGHCCTWCVDRHRAWLGEIVELYATLPDVIPPGAVVDDTGEYQKPRKRPASPAPMALAAWAMLHDTARLFAWGNRSDLPDIPAVLAAHTDRLYSDLGFGAAPVTVSGAAAALTANADTVAALPWVDEYDAELAWLRTSLRTAHGLKPPEPIADCLGTLRGEECRGIVHTDPQGGVPVCNRCARRYSKLDLVRLHVHQRRQSA